MMHPKVALIYDRVNTPHGGAEKVLLAWHQLFPNAPLYTSVYDPDVAKWASVFDVRTSFLQHIPGLKQAHRWLAPFMPLAFESLDLSEFDLIISMTSAEAKGVMTQPHQLHVCYLLTPTRYLYSHRQEYLGTLPNWPGVRRVAAQLMRYIIWWDQIAATRPDVYLAISQLVADRCQQAYHQTPHAVIYPPVAEPLTRMASQTKVKSTVSPARQSQLPKDGYYLVVSRLVPYKKIDLVIRACIALKRRLVIVGDGPARNAWHDVAVHGLTRAHLPVEFITFKGHASDQELIQLHQQATAVLMPGIEDFGITAVEAVAQGVPVVIHRQSGAAEILQDGQDGIFLDQLSVKAVQAAMLKLEKTKFNTSQMKKKMRKYVTTMFCQRFEQTVMTLWNNFQSERKL